MSFDKIFDLTAGVYFYFLCTAVYQAPDSSDKSAVIETGWGTYVPHDAPAATCFFLYTATTVYLDRQQYSTNNNNSSNTTTDSGGSNST